MGGLKSLTEVNFVIPEIKEKLKKAKNKDKGSAGSEGNSKDHGALGISGVNFKKFP